MRSSTSAKGTEVEERQIVLLVQEGRHREHVAFIKRVAVEHDHCALRLTSHGGNVPGRQLHAVDSLEGNLLVRPSVIRWSSRRAEPRRVDRQKQHQRAKEEQ